MVRSISAELLSGVKTAFLVVLLASKMFYLKISRKDSFTKIALFMLIMQELLLDVPC